MKLRKVALVAAAVITATIALCATTWQILPDPFGLIPLQIRLHLPDEVVSFISTPIPTALPAPLISQADSQAALVVPELPTTTATPSPTSQSLQDALPTLTSIPSSISDIVATAAATDTPTPTPTATPTIAPIGIIEGLEIIAQEFNNCGPANLTMVLNFYQHELGQTEVGDALKPSYEDRNVSPDEMTAFVRESTQLEARYYSGGDRELLKRLLASGFPVIIEKGFLPSESLGWMGHYLTLVGYDDMEQAFLTMDSYLGPWDNSGRYESYEYISELWEHFNNTFVVVFEQDDDEELSRILGSSFDSPNAMWLNSANWAESRTLEDSDNAFAYFNLGTSLTELGESTGRIEFFENAALAFDRAREFGLPWRMLWYQFKPYRAYLEVGRIDEVLALTLLAQSIEETHLFRGHALLASGDSRGAGYSYRQALQMNPNYDAAEAALNALGE